MGYHSADADPCLRMHDGIPLTPKGDSPLPGLLWR